MGFFDKLKTVADGAIVMMDKSVEQTVRKLKDEELLSKLSEKPNNKYFLAEAKKRRLI